MSTRAELKENILASKVEGVVQWVVANWSTVATAFGIGIVGILIGSVFLIRNRERQDAVTTRLGLTESLAFQKQYDQAEQILNDLQSQPLDRASSLQASYYRGVVALGLHKPEDAVRFFSETVDKAGASPFKPLALANLGFSYEEKKDDSAAAGAYGRFMTEFPDHFLAPRIQLAMGRTLFIAGKTEEAKKALGQLIDLYPTSEWAQNARSFMDKIKTR